MNYFFKIINHLEDFQNWHNTKICVDAKKIVWTCFFCFDQKNVSTNLCRLVCFVSTKKTSQQKVVRVVEVSTPTFDRIPRSLWFPFWTPKFCTVYDTNFCVDAKIRQFWKSSTVFWNKIKSNRIQGLRNNGILWFSGYFWPPIHY